MNNPYIAVSSHKHLWYNNLQMRKLLFIKLQDNMHQFCVCLIFVAYVR